MIFLLGLPSNVQYLELHFTFKFESLLKTKLYRSNATTIQNMLTFSWLAILFQATTIWGRFHSMFPNTNIHNLVLIQHQKHCHGINVFPSTQTFLLEQFPSVISLKSSTRLFPFDSTANARRESCYMHKSLPLVHLTLICLQSLHDLWKIKTLIYHLFQTS
jgi:hypothetical protein